MHAYFEVQIFLDIYQLKSLIFRKFNLNIAWNGQSVTTICSNVADIYTLEIYNQMSPTQKSYLNKNMLSLMQCLTKDLKLKYFRQRFPKKIC